MARLFTVSLLTLAVTASIPTVPLAQRRTAPVGQKPALTSFTTPLTLAEMTGKQAVVNTTAGIIVIDLRPDLAPNHVGYFMKLAREGGVRRHDLSSRHPTGDHPGRRSAVEGSCEGQALWDGRARRAESGAQRRTGDARRGRGGASAQSARFSAGSQFFICVTDQPRARRQVHGLRSRLRGNGRRAEDLRGAGRCRGRAERAH